METKTETERPRISCVVSCTWLGGDMTVISQTMTVGHFQSVPYELFLLRILDQG